MKNTFVKLFLALALCFMVGCALVACGGSSVAISEDGYWVIDGEKTNVKAAAESVADCNHEIVEVEVKAHTATKDGVVLEVCALCNDYAKVTAGTIHDWDENGVKAASCTTDGFAGEICTVCGETGEGEVVKALGHDYVASKAIAKALGKPACLNDAVVVSHCSVCYAVSEPEVKVGGVGHVVEAWATSNYPSNIASGEASGTCIYCESTVTYALPVLAEANYDTAWKNGVAPTCFEGATQLFTYVAKNEMNAEKVWDTNLNFSTEWKQPAAKHQLAGKDYTAWANKDYGTEVINFFGDVDGNGKVDDGEKTGVKAFAGDKLVCGVPADAYFVCEACDEVVDVVAYADHNGPTKEVKAAYCNVAGENEVTCNECKTVVKSYPYADHDTENGYTLTVVEYGKDKNGKDVPSKFELKWECPNVATVPYVDGKDANGKDIVKTKEVECTECSSKILAAANVSAGANVAATCYDPGYTEYTYIDVENNNKPTTVKVPGKLTAHTLNGALVEDLDKLDVATPGVKAFSGKAFDKGCEFDYEGVAYFVCSVCAEAEAAGLVESAVVDIPTISRTHDKIEEITKAAACKTTGLMNVKCSYSDCTYAENNVKVDALGHDFANATAYVYKVANKVNTYAVNIDATCSRNCEDEDRVIDINDKVLPALDPEVYVVETIAEATCSSGNIKKYTITLDLNGDPAKVDTENSTKDETVYVKPNVTVSFDVVDNNVIAHTWNEDLVLKTDVENDYNKDGIVDVIEHITFKYCKVCCAYKTSEVVPEKLTDIPADWKAPAEDEE